MSTHASGRPTWTAEQLAALVPVTLDERFCATKLHYLFRDVLDHFAPRDAASPKPTGALPAGTAAGLPGDAAGLTAVVATGAFAAGTTTAA